MRCSLVRTLTCCSAVRVYTEAEWDPLSPGRLGCGLPSCKPVPWGLAGCWHCTLVRLVKSVLSESPQSPLSARLGDRSIRQQIATWVRAALCGLPAPKQPSCISGGCQPHASALHLEQVHSYEHTQVRRQLLFQGCPLVQRLILLYPTQEQGRCCHGSGSHRYSARAKLWITTPG